MIWVVIITVIVLIILINMEKIKSMFSSEKDKHQEKGFQKKYTQEKKSKNPLEGVGYGDHIEILPTPLKQIGIKDGSFKVNGKNKIIYGSDFVAYELVLENGSGQIVSLEWDEDTHKEVTLFNNEKLSLKDINIDNEEVSGSYLERMENDDDLGELKYDNKTFDFDESCRAKFIENCDQEPKVYYGWDFEEVEEEDLIVSIEDWDGSLEAFLGVYINIDHLKIHSSQ